MLNQDYNITILMSAHDLTSIKNECSRIIAIDDAKITYDGLASKWEVQ